MNDDKYKIDPVEIETISGSSLVDTVLTALIAIGLIVVILRPYIINYFTK